MNIKNFADAQTFLYNFINYETKTSVPYTSRHYNLENFREFLHLLDDPNERLPSIHIAGTKGKGSTSAFTASMLQALGYQTGLYTSPHLVNIRERMRVNGKAISEQDFVRWTQKISETLGCSDRIAADGYRTTFELLTAIAFLYFHSLNLDWAVFEVGMGGRLDCTNVINPSVSLITPISKDHMESLGNTISGIVLEKTGILRENIPAVIAKQSPTAWKCIRKFVENKDIPVISVTDMTRYRISRVTPEGSIFTVRIRGGVELHDLEIKLPGMIQIENAIHAIIALYELHKQDRIIWDESLIRKGLINTRWPGRLHFLNLGEWFPGSFHGRVLVDGAHNPAAMSRLVKELIRFFPGVKPTIILGVPSNKDVRGILTKIAPIASAFILTRYQNSRSMDLQTLKEVASNYHSQITTAENLQEALVLASKLTPKPELLVITGSLYLTGELLELAGLTNEALNLW